MIQRKQSLYLLILAVVSIIVSFSNAAVLQFKGVGLYNGNAIDKAMVSYSQLTFSNGEEVVNIVSPSKTQFILWSIALLAILAILSFKNRKRQITFCSFNFAFMLFIPVFIYLDLRNVQQLFTQGDIRILISATFPLALIIMNFLAVRAIIKDHNLIKSMDRLR
jgi:hypothetical protein